MNSDNPLCVQFGDNAALIWCDDSPLRQSLSQYFRHCLRPVDCLHPGDCLRPVDSLHLGNTVSVIATYQITTTNRGELQLWRDDKLLHPAGSEPFYVFTYLTRDVVAKLVTCCQQHLVFHAAGLARGRQGLILCGQSGSGKSTLAAWLTVSGFDFLTDELVAVTFDRYEMSGLAGPIVIKPDSAFIWQHWLDQAVDQSSIHFFGGTAWLDPELLRPHCVRATAYPHLLIFPRYAAGEPLVAQQLSTAEAVFRLMPQLVNFENLPDRGFALVHLLQVKQGQDLSSSLPTQKKVVYACVWV